MQHVYCMIIHGDDLYVYLFTKPKKLGHIPSLTIVFGAVWAPCAIEQQSHSWTQLFKTHTFPKRSPSNMEVRFGTLCVTNFHVVCAGDTTFISIFFASPFLSSTYSTVYIFTIIYIYNMHLLRFFFLASCDDGHSDTTDMRCFFRTWKSCFRNRSLKLILEYLSQRG